MTSLRCLALVLPAFIAACAAGDPQPAATTTTTRQAPEYRTGSNIPVREPRPAAEERERTAKPAETRPSDGQRPTN